MTSRLSLLQSRLVRFNRARALLRLAAALAALISSLVIAAFVVFAIDFSFRLGLSERLAVMGIAAAAVGWSLWRYALPILRRHESLTETALFVERQQQIDSDLVAALQFDSATTLHFESPRLATAVVDYVSAATPSIRVFNGVLPRELPRRTMLMAVCVIAAIAAIMIAPRHATVFLRRICLIPAQYPTRTHIERIFVNRTLVYPSANNATAPADVAAPQSRPLNFLVECSGQLPATGIVDVAATGGRSPRSQLQLTRVTTSQRLAWLRDASARLSEALASPPGELSPQLMDDVAALVQCDAPQAIQPLLVAERTTELQPVLVTLERTLRDFMDVADRKAIYQTELSHLHDDLKYKVTLGDTTTQFAEVKLIPLPIVQLEIIPQPPDYARLAINDSRSSGLQQAILEGSTVKAHVACANKQLKWVRMTLQHGGARERIDFLPDGQDLRHWSPANEGSLIRDVTHELHYELQVLDADGLSLETPIRGLARIQADKPPTTVAKVVHKLVLPTASPVVAYQVDDDFGVSGATLAVEIERGALKDALQNSSSDESARTSGAVNKPAPAEIEIHHFDVLSTETPVPRSQLPKIGTYPLSLEPMKLVPGDRLKLTMEVRDFRGVDSAGHGRSAMATSEPIILEVASEAAVLAAVAEADKLSERQLSEIIERQLSSGGDRQ